MPLKIEHVREQVAAIIKPHIVAARSLLQTWSNQFNTTTVELKGAVNSEPTPLDSDTITISGIVDPTMHSHTTATVKGTSSPAKPNTVVSRGSQSKLTSSGSTKNNSGYKLADGRDLTSFMFPGVSDAMFTVGMVNTNSSLNQNAIVDAYLAKSGQRIILYRTYGWVCNCINQCACQCCD